MYLRNIFLAILTLPIYLMSISCSPLQKRGYLITYANDTIKGRFAELSYYAGNIACIYNNSVPATTSTTFTIKDANTNTNNLIKVNDIKSLNVVDKKNKVTSTYIFNTYFWKLLFAKGNLGVYMKYHLKYAGMYSFDEPECCGPAYRKCEDIAIFLDSVQKVQIYSGYQLTIIDNKFQVSEQILPFINKRYNLSLTQDELLKYINQGETLQNQTYLYNFILDKEAELEEKQAGK